MSLFGDVRVELYDGSFHEVDSSVGAFWIAAGLALRDALAKAPLVRLMPVMSVEIRVPAMCASAVLRDFQRRGSTDSVVHSDGVVTLNARVPLSRMIGYTDDLDVLALGDGAFSVRLDRFEPSDEASEAVWYARDNASRPEDGGAPFRGPEGDDCASVGARIRPRPTIDHDAIALPEPGTDVMELEPPVSRWVEVDSKNGQHSSWPSLER